MTHAAQVVALYCRLSPRPDGSYEGVELQEDWGREYAAQRWPGASVEVFADKGISAANGDHRPEYERLREWINGGRVAHVWAVEQTRLERREIEWFTLAAELDGAGISEIHTNRDGIVRVRDEVASIKAVLAASEVRKLKQRTRDRLDANAKAGQPAGSKPFGYAHAVIDGVKTYVIVDDQAKAIRQAAEWVLAGWSLANIARELNNQGVKSARGSYFRNQTVRKFLRAPTIAGYRVHRDEIVGRGNWPAILDADTWHEVVSILDQPRTVTTKDGKAYPVPGRRGPAAKRYLLSGGLIVCGVCDAPMIGAVKTLSRNRKVPYYSCHPIKRNPNGDKGKGCVTLTVDTTEKYVLDEMWTELDKPEFLDALGIDEAAGRRDEIGRELQKLDMKARSLAAAWADDGLTDDEWHTARARLEQRQTTLRRELSELPPPNARVDIRHARAAWPAMTLDEQREFVRLFVGRVVVNRAQDKMKDQASDRVKVHWRGR